MNHIALYLIVYVVLFTLAFTCGGIACSVESEPEKEAKDPALARSRTKKRMGFLFGFIFLFGLLFVFIGYVIDDTYTTRSLTWDAAQAVITGFYHDTLNDTNTFLVSYQYHGQFFENIKLSYYDSFMLRGDTVPILIDPKEPNSIQYAKGMSWTPLIFSGVGGILALFALYNIVSILLGTSRWIVTGTETPKTFGIGPNPTKVFAGKGFQAEWNGEVPKIWMYLFVSVIILIIGSAFGYAIYQYWDQQRRLAYLLIAFLVYFAFSMLHHWWKNRNKSE